MQWPGQHRLDEHRCQSGGGPQDRVSHPENLTAGPRGGVRLSRSEEPEHPLGEQCRRVRVVGRQRAVGEQVLVAGVDEQLGVVGLLRPALGRRRCRPRRRRTGRRPCRGSAPAPRWARPIRTPRPAAGVEEQCAPRPRPGLRQLLGRHHAERETGVDELGRQSSAARIAALEHLVEADLLGVADARRPGCRTCDRRSSRACARCGRPAAVRRQTRAHPESAPARGGTGLPQPSRTPLVAGIKHRPSSARRPAAPDR